jgi:geranylgeranyl reductase family protein
MQAAMHRAADHEVIIVGAGPAGSTAAIALARAGHDVLLLDRARFPRDKVCGDAVPYDGVATLRRLGLGRQIEAAGFYPVRELRLVSPNGTVYDSPLTRDRDGVSESCVVPRLKFDTLLWEAACAAGARFERAQVSAPLIENGQVVGVRARNGREREIRAPLVLAADGSTSTLSRALLPQRPGDQHRAVALRAYVDGMQLNEHMVEFYLYREILPGYSWIFPTNDGVANVGTGMRLDIFRKVKGDLRRLLDDFLKMPAIAARMPGARVRDVETWQLNLGSQPFGRAFGGALLIGDAGWFIDPLTGGGINNGIITALLAADTAHEALAARDFSARFLGRFDRRWRAKLWRSLRSSYWVQRVLVASPVLMDILLARLAKWKWGIEPFLSKM